MKNIIGFAVVALLAAQANGAIYPFADDFNTASSSDYTEGGFVGGNNGWTAPTTGVPFYTTDIAGDGLVELVGGTDNFIKMSRNLGTFDEGGTITVSSTFSVGSTGNIGYNAYGWFLAIGTVGNVMDIGVQVGGTGTDFIVSGIGGGASHTSVGARDLLQHTISADITKTATADTFDVSIYFDGNQVGASYQVVNNALYSGNVLMVNQAGGGGVNSLGGVDVDNVSVIPEPATIGLVAAFGGMLMFVRRRFTI